MVSLITVVRLDGSDFYHVASRDATTSRVSTNPLRSLHTGLSQLTVRPVKVGEADYKCTAGEEWVHIHTPESGSGAKKWAKRERQFSPRTCLG